MPEHSVESLFDDLDREQEQDRLRREQADQAREQLRDYELDEESENFDFPDTLMAIPRGAEGFGRSIVSIIPGVDLEDDRFFGRSEAVIGAGLESIIQFGLGFMPGLGVAGLLGKTATAARMTAALGSSKAGIFTLKALEGSVASGAAEFLATAEGGHHTVELEPASVVVLRAEDSLGNRLDVDPDWLSSATLISLGGEVVPPVLISVRKTIQYVSGTTGGGSGAAGETAQRRRIGLADVAMTIAEPGEYLVVFPHNESYEALSPHRFECLPGVETEVVAILSKSAGDTHERE